MKNLKNNNYNKILIIRLSSMGDIILASHLVRNIKERFINSSINIIVAEQYTEIFDNNPYITKVIKYDKTKNKFEQKQQKKEIFIDSGDNKYDLIIDLQRNFRSKRIYSGTGIKVLKINKNRLFKLALVYLKKRLPGRHKHITDLYLDTVMSVGVGEDGKGLELWLPEEKQSAVYPPERFTDGAIRRRNRIAIAPGAFHATKRWLPARFARLAELLQARYNLEIVLVGGKADMEICRDIISAARANISDYSGSASIYDTARILDTCRLTITNDTGVMHISAARRVPVAAIFGSTVPEFGFTPFRVHQEIIQKQLPCRPCTHYGKEACPKGHFNCMNLLEVNDVMNSAENLLL